MRVGNEVRLCRKALLRHLCAMIAMATWSGASIYGQAVLTWHNDNARTGQNLQEATLTPANVTVSTFGKLFVIPVDGKVDAQPLYVPSLTIPAKGAHNVLYVVTEHDSAYAFDADLGTMLWHVSLLGAGETTSDDRDCFQVVPEIGVTSTPAIDAQSGPHGTMYVVAMSKDGSGNYHQRLHALDLTTGAEQFGGPTEVQATYPGAGAEGSGSVLTFDPKLHKERAGLLIVNGVVYTSWASHCDVGPYTSWVIGYDEATLRQMSVLNLTPNGGGGGIWSAGGGPAADASGNLYLLMGNGTFDTTLSTSGFPVNRDFGNAFVKISTSGGTLAVTDYFTMSNTLSESDADLDLGSGGLLLLPPLHDSQGKSRALAVGAGKDQNIYVVDRNNLGKFNPKTDAIYQELPAAVSPVYSSPAWFNGTVYYGSVGDVLKAFAFANGAFALGPASQSPNTFGYPGTTPSISANGTSNGIVWAAENETPAVLHAYDASDLSRELYNSNQAANGRDHFGEGNKFIVPTVVNGKVYVGTTTGVGVFGLLGLPCSYAIAPQSVTFTATGGTGVVNVTAASGCAWTATSNAPWLTIISGASGTGNGTVSYSVMANNSVSPSLGTLTIAGQTLTVTRAGVTTTITLTPSSTTVGSGASTGTIVVTVTPSDATWTASSNVAWITITLGASGTGNGIVGYAVQANNSFNQRVGTLTIGGQTFTVTQGPATPPPVILPTTTVVQFAYMSGGALPAPQAVTLTNGGGGTLLWFANSNEPWLSVAPASGVAPSTLTIFVNPVSLGPGIYLGNIAITANGATNNPQNIAVNVFVTAPAPSVTSVTNAASSASGAIAPGEIVAIKGSSLGPASGVKFSVNPATGMVDPLLAGTRALFGDFPAPIIYTSATQVNAIVPYEIAGQSQVLLQVEYQGVLAAPIVLPVGTASPGVFTSDFTGSGQAAALNQDGSLNGLANPAAKGSYVTLYFTGGGLTSPPGVTGSVTGLALKYLTQRVSVTVGGQAAAVTFAGAAPTYVDGLGQLNLRLADNAPSGAAQAVVVSVGGIATPSTATIAVR